MRFRYWVFRTIVFAAFSHFTCSLLIASALTWNAFLGGTGSDIGRAVAVDASGNVYISGQSNATWGTPVRAYTASADAFVAKLDPYGNLVWNTFLGGSGSDFAYGIAVDGNGNVFVGGYSSAAWGTPVQAFNASNDCFVAKLDNNGTLLWNTFIGGTASDDCKGIVLDGSGNIFVAGSSFGSWGTPVRAFTVAGGAGDTYVAKLSSTGSLVWNTFLGGASATNDNCYGIAIDGSGNLYALGVSGGTWGTPVTAFAGSTAAYVAKLASDGSLTWNTFVGGAGLNAYPGAIAVDASSNVYMCGSYTDTWGTPVRAFTTGSSTNDVCVVKLNSDGTLGWNTFLGSSDNDYGYGVAVDGSGNVYATGASAATWDTPVRAYTFGNDVFAAKLSSNGVLTWNTFLGYAGTESANAMTVDAGGRVFIVGGSGDTWETPTRAYASGNDAFVARLTSGGAVDMSVVPVTFADGSAFTNTVTPGGTDQVLGCFKLTGATSSAMLSAVSFTLNGTRTGLSNFKLWSSSDATFGGDTQLGSTIAADPGDGGTAAFSGFSSTIGTGGTYYFLTADVSGGATGSMQEVITGNASLTIGYGAISGTITNAALSGGSIPLPVELTSITATSERGSILLSWETATELHNYGYEIERRTVTPSISSLLAGDPSSHWTTIGFVKGSGTSNVRKSYTFADRVGIAGSYAYRLKQIDNNGAFTYSPSTEATIAAPSFFTLAQNYPNPFNPSTTIEFTLESDGPVSLKVFDILGQEVSTLVDEALTAGNVYRVRFDAAGLASGIYLYRLEAGAHALVRRLQILK